MPTWRWEWVQDQRSRRGMQAFGVRQFEGGYSGGYYRKHGRPMLFEMLFCACSPSLLAPEYPFGRWITGSSMPRTDTGAFSGPAAVSIAVRVSSECLRFMTRFLVKPPPSRPWHPTPSATISVADHYPNLPQYHHQHSHLSLVP